VTKLPAHTAQLTWIKPGSRAGTLKEGIRSYYGAKRVPGEGGMAIELKKVNR